MSTEEILVLSIAALLAGAMNAIAGGGTILTFPALIAFGMPAIRANATSTLALVLGIVGSAYAYRSHFPAVAPWLRRMGPASVAGGVLGAWLLTVTPEALFSNMVPFLLLFATVLFMAQGPVRRWLVSPGHSTVGVGAVVVCQFFVAIYGGYFGAGIGILMLAAFGLLGFTRIHEMNALKTMLAVAINLVAAGYFILADLIDWPQAWVMTIGSTLGYFAGAHFSQRIPEHIVRKLVVAIGLLISASLFWKTFASA